MKYRHLIDKPDYSDYASGKVLLWGPAPKQQQSHWPKGIVHAGGRPARAGFARAFRREFIRQPLGRCIEFAP